MKNSTKKGIERFVMPVTLSYLVVIQDLRLLQLIFCMSLGGRQQPSKGTLIFLIMNFGRGES